MGIFGSKSKSTSSELEVVPLNSVTELEPVRRMKYRLSHAKESVTNNFGTFYGYRLEALIDIPLHGVKAGDKGGLVDRDYILSHEGSCWIGGDAFVAYPRNPSMRMSRSMLDSQVSIIGDALVTDKAYVTSELGGSVKVSGNAYVDSILSGSSVVKDNGYLSNCAVHGSVVISENARIKNMCLLNLSNPEPILIGGDVEIRSKGNNRLQMSAPVGNKISIKGKARLNNVTVDGSLLFDAEVNLEDVHVDGDTTILGKPQIKPGVKFTGRNVISGDSLIPPGSHVHDVIMDYGVLQYGAPQSFSDARALEQAPSMTPIALAAPVLDAGEQLDITEYIDVINQIEADYEAYTTDIVKLIKFPAMADASVPEVADFVSKLRAAKRALKSGSAVKLRDLSEALDLAFVRAENKVQTLVASHLDEAKKKSLKTAEKMFKLACDEASPEPEKRLGFKAGMRELEGVVPVSEKAADNMRAKIGLLELEV